MRIERVFLPLLFVGVAFAAESVAAKSCPGVSEWRNDRGSTLLIERIDEQGRIEGSYINRAAGFRCRDTRYPVTGWLLQETRTITFAVKWDNAHENCGSQTAWTGMFDATCEQLTTRWQLVRQGALDADEILTGGSVFRRKPPADETP